MKILFCSHVFEPSVGGIETVGRLLAEEFAAQGHSVTVLTETPGEGSFPFEIVRRPSASRVIALARSADVVFHNNLSLRIAWPAVLAGKPSVVTHHTWLTSPLKRWLLRFARNISISSAIANSLPLPSEIIPDPYDANIFHVRREIARERDLVFLGRLVSDKGCDLLLQSLRILEANSRNYSLTVIGDGPERSSLEAQAHGDVRFAGMLQAPEVARELNRHRIAVLPSRWNEPFGVAALEAIACGCAVIGSSGGGLPDAIGRCGTTFPNGRVEEMAAAIDQMLAGGTAGFTKHSEAHLKRHHPTAVAARYLEFFAKACASG